MRKMCSLFRTLRATSCGLAMLAATVKHYAKFGTFKFSREHFGEIINACRTQSIQRRALFLYRFVALCSEQVEEIREAGCHEQARDPCLSLSEARTFYSERN